MRPFLPTRFLAPQATSSGVWRMITLVPMVKSERLTGLLAAIDRTVDDDADEVAGIVWEAVALEGRVGDFALLLPPLSEGDAR